MKRRRLGTAPRTAADAVELLARAQADARELHLDRTATRDYVAAFLAEHGTDVVEVIRARRWLRRGLPGASWRH